MPRRSTSSLRRVNAATPPTKGRSDYHHGALRAALLDAAQALLLDVGLEGFSLRECAKRAGVSHGAPAHHFGDLKGLLTAFATVGFERMAQRMQHDAAAAGDAPDQRLLAVGQAYVAFALEHPAHFRLMFRCDRLHMSDPALQQASAAAAQALAWAMSDALASRGVPPRSLQDRCLLAWSTVHGLATLMLDTDLAALGVAGRSVEDGHAVSRRLLARLKTALLSDAG